MIDLNNFDFKTKEWFKGESARLTRYSNELQEDIEKRVTATLDLIKTVQYSNKHLVRDCYNPSPVQHIVVGNNKRGKIYKSLTKTSKPTYEYGFDIDDNIIFARTVNNNYTEIISRDGNIETGIVYNKAFDLNSETDRIFVVGVNETVFDENNRVKSFLSFTTNPYLKSYKEINYEQYTYTEDGKLYTADLYFNYMDNSGAAQSVEDSIRAMIFSHNSQEPKAESDVVEHSMYVFEPNENTYYSQEIKRNKTIILSHIFEFENKDIVYYTGKRIPDTLYFDVNTPIPEINLISRYESV